MKRVIFFLLVTTVFATISSAQVAINTDGSAADGSAMLEIKSFTKGLLIPRMSESQKHYLLDPATSLLIYQIDGNSGFYYNNGSSSSPNWVRLFAGEINESAWALTGNSGTTSGTNFIGTTDDEAFDLRTNDTIRVRFTTKGQIEILNTGHSIFIGEGAGANDDLSDNYNTFIGYRAGMENTTGRSNSAYGALALYSNMSGLHNTAAGKSALYYNTTGSQNTAIGEGALIANRANSSSTAIGHYAMYQADSRTSGRTTYNTAIGNRALMGSNTAANNTGQYNTAVGDRTLFGNTSGSYNTSVGSSALYSNSTGEKNTAIGNESLLANTSGNYNTAIGVYALNTNKANSRGTAIGYKALQYADDRTSGRSTYNTAVGAYALMGSTTAANNTGQYNTAVGDQALYDNTSGSYNSSHGYLALTNNTTGAYNTAFGYSAFSTGTGYTNSTALGNNAEPGASNKIMLGNSSITWIGGYTTWSNASDERMKNNIKDDVKGLDFIMKLRPVTYNFDKDKMDNLIGTIDSSDYPEKYDVEKIKQSGFLAQEVEQAAKKAGYDFSGVNKPKGDVNYYSLAYAEFVVPLVKAVQELADRNEQLAEKVGGQQLIIEKQDIIIEALIKRMEVLENSK